MKQQQRGAVVLILVSVLFSIPIQVLLGNGVLIGALAGIATAAGFGIWLLIMSWWVHGDFRVISQVWGAQ